MAPARKLLFCVLMLAILAPDLAAGQDSEGSQAAESEAFAQQAATVGNLLVRLARAMDPDLPADLAAEAALTSLRARGLALEGKVDLAAPVTEGEAVRLAAAADIHLRTDNPGTPLTPERVSALVGLLHDGLAGVEKP